MDNKNNSHDLLGIIDNLVDNIQDSNINNTEILNSVNISLTKISEYMPEIKLLSTRLNDLIYNLKIIVAIIGIILTFGIIILGMYQKNMEVNISNQVTSKIIEKIIEKNNNPSEGSLYENKTIFIKK